MSETEFLTLAWQSCIKRVIAEIETYSAGWMEGGPSKATARAILNRVRAMPVPVPKQEKSQ